MSKIVLALLLSLGCGGATARTTEPSRAAPIAAHDAPDAAPAADATHDASDAALDARGDAPDAIDAQVVVAEPPLVWGEVWRLGPQRYLDAVGTADPAMYDSATPFRPCGRQFPGECRALPPTPSTAGTITLVSERGVACSSRVVEEVDVLMRVRSETRLLAPRPHHLYRFEGCASAYMAFLGEAQVITPPAASTLGPPTPEEARALRDRAPGCRFRVGSLGDAGRIAVLQNECEVAVDVGEVVIRPDGQLRAFMDLIAVVESRGTWFALAEWPSSIGFDRLDDAPP